MSIKFEHRRNCFKFFLCFSLLESFLHENFTIRRKLSSTKHILYINVAIFFFNFYTIKQLTFWIQNEQNCKHILNFRHHLHCKPYSFYSLLISFTSYYISTIYFHLSKATWCLKIKLGSLHNRFFWVYHILVRNFLWKITVY